MYKFLCMRIAKAFETVTTIKACLYYYLSKFLPYEFWDGIREMLWRRQVLYNGKYSGVNELNIIRTKILSRHCVTTFYPSRRALRFLSGRLIRRKSRALLLSSRTDVYNWRVLSRLYCIERPL